MAEDIIGGYRLLKCLRTGQSSQVWEVVETQEPSPFRHEAAAAGNVAADAEAKRLLYHEAKVGKKLDASQHHPHRARQRGPKNNPLFRHGVFPGRQPEAAPDATSNTISSASSAQHLQAGGDGPGVHERQRLGASRHQAGQYPRQQRRRGCASSTSPSPSRSSKPGFFGKLFHTASAGRRGTRSYMSPEQIRGETLDGRADIYSFGATAYEIVTYRPPFRAASQQELLQKQIIEKPPHPQVYNSDVTDEFGNLLLKMLSKKPEQRPQSFHEVLKGINSVKIYKTPVGEKKR